MANWNLPSLTDFYTNFLTYLKVRDDDAVRLNDTRVTAPDNPPSYAKRWNDSTQTFQNWWSSVWSNLILGIAGGGTGSATAAGARTNLDVYSTTQVNAAIAVGLSYSESTGIGDVTMASASTWYDGPSISLAAGTWLVFANADMAGTINGSVDFIMRIKHGGLSEASTTRTIFTHQSQYMSTSASATALIVLGSTTTVKIECMATIAGAKIIEMSNAIPATYIRAVKIV